MKYKGSLQQGFWERLWLLIKGTDKANDVSFPFFIDLNMDSMSGAVVAISLPWGDTKEEGKTGSKKREEGRIHSGRRAFWSLFFLSLFASFTGSIPSHTWHFSLRVCPQNSLSLPSDSVQFYYRIVVSGKLPSLHLPQLQFYICLWYDFTVVCLPGWTPSYRMTNIITIYPVLDI